VPAGVPMFGGYVTACHDGWPRTRHWCGPTIGKVMFSYTRYTTGKLSLSGPIRLRNVTRSVRYVYPVVVVYEIDRWLNGRQCSGKASARRRTVVSGCKTSRKHRCVFRVSFAFVTSYRRQGGRLPRPRSTIIVRVQRLRRIPKASVTSS